MNVQVNHPTPSGQIKVCDFWTFIQEVRKQVTPGAYNEIARLKKLEYTNPPKFRYAPQAQDSLYATTYHILKMNPASVLVELKKTTTLIDRRSEMVDFDELLHEVTVKSLMEFGDPTHFFPIGKGRYALVNANEDVRLYTKEDFSQSLVCLYPKRNFQIYAPFLKIGNL